MIGPPVAKLRQDIEQCKDKDTNNETTSTGKDKSKDTNNDSKTNISENEDDSETRLEKFIKRNNSLHLSASKIAACCGLNPFSNLPKLVIDLIYQGRTGRELLQRDADTIGISLQTDEEILTEISSKAGKDTVQAFQHALKVKPKTIQEVDEVRKKVVEAASKSKKLEEYELKALEDGVRHLVNTGFGTMHEEDVLDLYEVQFGWDVRERNAVIREWPFVRDEGSVVPLREASEMVNKHREEEEKKEDSPAVKKRKTSNDTNSNESSEPQSKEDTKESKAEEERPYFSILGAVDGIRDELIPSSESDEYGPSFSLQEVIIECKHRMRKCTIPPPLYDQIQAVAYCYMYNTNSAEIVQALRNDSDTANPEYEMHVSKITLNDPIYNHSQNFKNVILPRLRSFVDMVYGIRGNDVKRMQFLLYVAGSMENERPSWEFLFGECAWLQDCDTAWKRL